MNYKKFLGAAGATLTIVIILTLVLAPGAWAQSKYKTLHKFTDGKDGLGPSSNLIFDPAGNLYGTTTSGGTSTLCESGCGTVFKLTPNANGGWNESVLYSFCSLRKCNDGQAPNAGLIFDQGGNLYGTTFYGGGGCFYGCGVVFELTPHPDGRWTEKVLHHFTGADGSDSSAGLIFDRAGNLYGTTRYGGGYGPGNVFELAPNSDGSWTENVLYSFTGGQDGGGPVAALIFDGAGNLYGTTQIGGTNGQGVIFKLIHNSDGSWSEIVLYQFTGGKDGSQPNDSLIFDQAGNLYGTTFYSSHCAFYSLGCGVVFELTPNSDGSWTESILRRFNGPGGAHPKAGLIFDQAGNLYGTTESGGKQGSCVEGCGVVFKLAPNSKGGWNETVLHYFVNNPGADPYGGLVFDGAGNLYGATLGYSVCCGSVFEITP